MTNIARACIMNESLSYEEKEKRAEQQEERLIKSLKPCPLCGSKADITSYSGGSGNYGSYTKLQIYCPKCGLKLDGADISWLELCDYIDKEEELAKKWNHRV